MSLLRPRPPLRHRACDVAPRGLSFISVFASNSRQPKHKQQNGAYKIRPFAASQAPPHSALRHIPRFSGQGRKSARDKLHLNLPDAPAQVGQGTNDTDRSRPTELRGNFQRSPVAARWLGATAALSPREREHQFRPQQARPGPTYVDR